MKKKLRNTNIENGFYNLRGIWLHLEILHTKKDALNHKCSRLIPNHRKLNNNSKGLVVCAQCSLTPYDLCAKCLYAVEDKLEQLEKLGIALGIPIKD